MVQGTVARNEGTPNDVAQEQKKIETPCQSDRLADGYVNCCVYLGKGAISMHVYTPVYICIVWGGRKERQRHRRIYENENEFNETGNFTVMVFTTGNV